MSDIRTPAATAVSAGAPRPAHLTAGWLMKTGERPYRDFFVFHGLAADAGLDALVLGDPPSPLRPRRLQTVLDAATVALLVPIALVFVIYVLARPTSWGSRALQRSFDRAPTLRPGLIALLITRTIDFAINDSGVAVPANGALIAVPLIITVSVGTLLDEARANGGSRTARRR